MDFEVESEILKALGHPIRLQIVNGLLTNQECNVNMMSEKLHVPQSTVSQHLGVLKSRGLIQPKKKGVETCYFVSDPRVEKILSSLK